MGKTIPLHPKHGVNPTMVCCEICHTPTGELALLGNHVKTEAPRYSVIKGCLCTNCRGTLDKGGLIVIECESAKSEKRTGRMLGLTRDGANKFFDADKLGDAKVVLLAKEHFDPAFGIHLESIKALQNKKEEKAGEENAEVPSVNGMEGDQLHIAVKKVADAVDEAMPMETPLGEQIDGGGEIVDSE